MIRTVYPGEPSDFKSRVRRPGLVFLGRHPNPSGRDWAKHSYWRHAHGYLHKELSGICSYCATFTPRRRSSGGLDHTSIDHYVPKSKPNHHQAYEWSNLRLCRSRLNHRKGDFEDVIDPCRLTARWFSLDFKTFKIVPCPGIAKGTAARVEETIRRLGLNSDDSLVIERTRAVYWYADGRMSIEDLKRQFPFVASEVVEQDFDNSFLPLFRTVLNRPEARAALARQGFL